MLSVLAILLLWLSYQDIRTRHVSVRGLCTLGACALLGHMNTLYTYDFLQTAVVFLVLLLFKGLGRLLARRTALGLGDVVVIALLSGLLTLAEFAYLLIITGVASCTFAWVMQCRSLPLVPFITLAFLSIKFL